MHEIRRGEVHGRIIHPLPPRLGAGVVERASGVAAADAVYRWAPRPKREGACQRAWCRHAQASGALSCRRGAAAAASWGSVTPRKRRPALKELVRLRCPDSRTSVYSQRARDRDDSRRARCWRAARSLDRSRGRGRRGSREWDAGVIHTRKLYVV